MQLHFHAVILLTTLHFCQPANVSLSKPASPARPLVFRNAFLSVARVTRAEIKAFKRSQNARPKLDFVHTGTRPQSNDAGRVTKGLIIGGAKALRGSFPWHGYMVVDQAYVCGSSLISPKYCVTAGHCVYGFTIFTITLGGIDSTTNEDGEITMTSSNVTIHPNYKSSNLNYDVALVTLPKPVENTPYIRSIKLPSYSDAARSFTKQFAYACGYGMTKETDVAASKFLSHVQLSVISNTACFKIFGTSVIHSTICTAPDKSKSICSGDSGGSLVMKGADGAFVLVGVVSFGSAITCTNFPAGFTRVTSVLGWLSTVTGIAVQYKSPFQAANQTANSKIV